MAAATPLKLIVNEYMIDQFTLNDVKELMYQSLVKKEHADESFQIGRIGTIVGFVDLNGELEVIVRFIDRLEQYNKVALTAQVDLITEDLEGDD